MFIHMHVYILSPCLLVYMPTLNICMYTLTCIFHAYVHIFMLHMPYASVDTYVHMYVNMPCPCSCTVWDGREYPWQPGSI